MFAENIKNESKETQNHLETIKKKNKDVVRAKKN